MKYAVVGSRTCTSPKRVFPVLKQFLSQGDMIVSGGAKGADKLAEQFAKEFEFTLRVFKAQWTRYGLKAGPLRNQKIVDECDEVIAFWDGRSKGTQNTINLAKRAKKPVHIYWV